MCWPFVTATFTLLCDHRSVNKTKTNPFRPGTGTNKLYKQVNKGNNALIRQLLTILEHFKNNNHS